MSRTEILELPEQRPHAEDFDVGFFVIGAQKAGTTSLHDWLAAQAGTNLPSLKETHFLSHDENWERGLEWYSSQFNTRASELRGEVDPEYLYQAHTARRMRELWPSACVVAVLRKPVERAYSQYQMSRARGLEELEFPAALAAEQERLAAGDPASTAHLHQSYLWRSCYAEHLAPFLREFPADRVRLVRFEDLFGERRSSTLTELAEFIGLTEALQLEAASGQSNARWTPRSRWLMDFLYGRSRLRRTLGRLLPSQRLRLRVGTWLERINRKTVSKRDPLPALSARWIEAFDRETRALEQLTGWDLADWYLGGRP